MTDISGVDFNVCLFLQKSGVAFSVENKLPNLVNLNEDPQLSEVLLYILKPGHTKVGQSSTTDIQLSGALIADNHWWVFENVLQRKIFNSFQFLLNKPLKTNHCFVFFFCKFL